MPYPDARLVIVNNRNGDWQGLYIDGALVDDGHSLGLKACLEYAAHAGVGPNDIAERIGDDGSEDGTLPDEIKDMNWHDE